MTFPHGQPVTLIRRTPAGTDSFGDTTLTETTTTVQGAFVPGPSSETATGGQTLVDQPTVYLPAGTALEAVDAVEVGGLRYEVDGDPNDWHSPFTGRAAGLEVRLRRVTGG